jgi:hypothetical protein
MAADPLTDDVAGGGGGEGGDRTGEFSRAQYD